MSFFLQPVKRLRSDDFFLGFLAFMMPILAMLCIFAGNGIYPFGDECFLRTDLYHQYAPFFAELARKLKQGGSLLYTWDIGMGTNFISLIGYYLSSVFNWLIALCSEEHVIEFISYLVIFKMGLAGLGFAMLLHKRREIHDARYCLEEIDFTIPFFALFYAMSGYLAAYSWNVMWLDCIWLAPLVLLGIERLVYEKKYLLYIITLAMAITSNYYIAIMLCMFCVLYFLIQLPEIFFPEDGDGFLGVLETCLRFAVSSLTAGALSAIILLPEIRALSLTASSDINFPTDWNAYFSILAVLGRHLVNVVTECGLDHWPNIYCGVGVLICIPLYYMNKSIRTSEKVSKTILLFFMLFSFSVNVPNFIWHGFHYPNSLPCRQSFLYIALVLIMCYDALHRVETLNAKMLGIAFGIGAGFIILCQAVLTDDALTFQSYWLSLLFIGIYTLLLFGLVKGRLPREVVFILMLIVITVESTANMALTSVTTVNRTEYLSYTKGYQELINKVESQDNGFYRFEKVARKTKNDGAFVGYPSISTFSSVSYGGVSDFYKALGMESSMNAYSNNGITPLLNSILDVKYTLATTPLQESQLMTLYEQNEDCYVYENLYTLSVGFMLPSGFHTDWDIDTQSAIDLQNSFSTLNGGKQLFYEIYDAAENGDSMDIHVNQNCRVFVQLDNTTVENITANINGSEKSFSNTNRGFLLDLGYCSPEDTITLSTTDENGSIQATPYYLDENALISLVEQLKQQQLQVTSSSDTRIRGTIDVKEDGLFFLSIPYDPGWTLYVDGVKTRLYRFQDALLCCDLTAGSHEIRLSYMPDGFLSGVIVTVAAVLLLITYEVAKRKGKIPWADRSE